MEGSILLLKGMSSSGGPSDDSKLGLIDALNAMIDKLRAECHAKYATQHDLDELTKKIVRLNEELKSTQHEVKDLEKDLSNQETSLYQCREITDVNKLDIDDLKKMFKDMVNQLGNLGAGAGNNTNNNNIGGNSNKNSKNNNNNNANSDLLSKQEFDDLLKKIKDLEIKVDTKVD